MRFLRKLPITFLVFPLLLSASCSAHKVEPYPEPSLVIESYSATNAVPASGSELSDNSQKPQSPWWLEFDSPELHILIDTGLEGNLEVAQARARLVQASQLIEQARARRLPEIGLGGDAQYRSSDDDDDTSIIMGGVLNWEIDLFGRLSSIVLARNFERRAIAEQLENTRLALSAAIAEAYYGLVEQKLQLNLLQEQVQIDRDLLALTERRFAAGIASRVDVLQQKGQLTETESLVPGTEAALRLLENTVDLLLGRPPGQLVSKNCQDSLPLEPVLPVAGIPSDLLLKRPDLRAAQASLAQADADIGRALAERLPGITLDGTFGYGAADASGLAAQGLFSLTQPLLDWGLRKAEVERNRALYVERLNSFSQTYLQAVVEVENTLYQLGKQREFIISLESRHAILEETVEETRKRYTGGLTDYLPVLDAVQRLRAVQRELLRQGKELMLLHVQLHVNLGGGKLPQDLKPDSGPQATELPNNSSQ